MTPRIPNPANLLPSAMDALKAAYGSTYRGGVPPSTLGLTHLRASQINGCDVCIETGTCNLQQAGESDDRLADVARWRESSRFTDAERAALALAESITRLSDRDDPLPDAVWNEAARHYDETGLAALVLSIAMSNVWNRLNVATRQTGATW